MSDIEYVDLSDWKARHVRANPDKCRITNEQEVLAIMMFNECYSPDPIVRKNAPSISRIAKDLGVPPHQVKTAIRGK